DLLFASDLRALLVEPDVDRALDDDALATYLALRYVPAPLTIIRGVRKLEPGCALVWEAGRAAVHRWWQAPTGARSDTRDVPAPPPTEAEAGGRLVQLLDEVVSTCRMSDVPLGTLLSGGLDSTLVTGILCQLARAERGPAVRTFSIGYLGRGVGESDELVWA